MADDPHSKVFLGTRWVSLLLSSLEAQPDFPDFSVAPYYSRNPHSVQRCFFWYQNLFLPLMPSNRKHPKVLLMDFLKIHVLFFGSFIYISNKFWFFPFLLFPRLFSSSCWDPSSQQVPSYFLSSLCVSHLSWHGHGWQGIYWNKGDTLVAHYVTATVNCH